MFQLIKYFLNSSKKRKSFGQQSTAGYTLIELLIAMIIAFIILTPLLAFAVDILDTDRKEQAKVQSEQEIDSALDYMSRDLQQAVYIYDREGLDNNTGIADQLPVAGNGQICPSGATCTPVLVFWKRTHLSKDDTDSKDQRLGAVNNENDAFVYSLVGYYLVEGADNDIWAEDAARITRFELRDGLNLDNDPDDKEFAADAGFQLFDTSSSGSLETKMNSWEKSNQDYGTNLGAVLVDYIDNSATGQTIELQCNTSKVDDNGTQLEQRIPSTGNGFFVCVDSANTSARVFLRGNALARIQNNNVEYKESQKSFFPTVGAEIKGNGFLFTK
ncbi:MAG: hormogonium polysaccharide secretion pseudopilin HpsC [Oscillatoria sp. PMC 1068.18]|nr:hormogonium polysaccharide secretion pseudopilin HpsC [Oscillatoria sp. PMC 1076.18]MEC4989540.1 hormogonium polysaccharide secretion pseudopilin HpsC [Oscillatoria sp. PMC 1068.18]